MEIYEMTDIFLFVWLACVICIWKGQKREIVSAKMQKGMREGGWEKKSSTLPPSLPPSLP